MIRFKNSRFADEDPARVLGDVEIPRLGTPASVPDPPAFGAASIISSGSLMKKNHYHIELAPEDAWITERRGKRRSIR